MQDTTRVSPDRRVTSRTQRRLSAARASQSSSRRHIEHSRSDPKRSQLSSTRAVQALLRWPSKAKLKIALRQTGKTIEKAKSGIIERGQQDLQRTVQASAPLSVYSEVWTFPICLITYSTMVIAWASELAGSAYPSWLCGSVGFFLGGTFALAHRAATVRVWVAPKKPLNVVITGGTRGIGRALVREFLDAGDNVYIAARSARGIRSATTQLADACTRPRQVAGAECDVSKPSSVARLVSLAQDHFADGTIDVWINNAGVSGGFKPFLEAQEEDLHAVVRTNLRGALLCSRAAIRAMALSPRQQRRGHLFNMDGAGADGLPTANYAAYGATKAGITHLVESLAAECRAHELEVGVHTLSPGMVLTSLLLDGATQRNKQFFNVICEHPETAAAFLVPRVRTVVARQEDSTYIRFLTNFAALGKLLTAPLRLGRFFSPDGSVNYLTDMAERMKGRGAKRTARTLSVSRRRGAELRVSYSVCLCLCVLLLSVDPAVMHDVSMPAALAWLNSALPR